MHRGAFRMSRWGRARDGALVLCAGWLVVQNVALLALAPRATLARVAGDAVEWVMEHPGLALGAVLAPVAVGVARATGMALGAWMARPVQVPRGREENHV